MKPIGPLMWEHRLIERMVGLLEKELDRASGKDGGVRQDIITVAVDFFRIYADRTHHGKEEDVLFKALDARPLSAEHRRTMEELIDEHKLARKLVGSLEKAGQGYARGESRELANIVTALRSLTELYPRHIEKEDKRFFFPVLDYFNQEEQDAMLREFYEFDRNMIHEKYRAVVAGLEGG